MIFCIIKNKFTKSTSITSHERCSIVVLVYYGPSGLVYALGDLKYACETRSHLYRSFKWTQLNVAFPTSFMLFVQYGQLGFSCVPLNVNIKIKKVPWMKLKEILCRSSRYTRTIRTVSSAEENMNSSKTKERIKRWVLLRKLAPTKTKGNFSAIEKL